MQETKTQSGTDGQIRTPSSGTRDRGESYLRIKLTAIMIVLFAILYGLLHLFGHWAGISGPWFYLYSSLAILVFQYMIGPFIIGAIMKVKWVSERDDPGLHSMVAELAAKAGVPKPRIGISYIDIPNAFAFGRTQRDGRICVTYRLKTLLSTNELRAVLGHEISHIKNRDVVVITMLSVVPMILYSIGRSLAIPSNGDGDGDSDQSAGLLLALAVFILYFITELLVLYGSRIREYYADRGAVKLGCQPHDLASALFKLSTDGTQVDLARIESARAFMISNPGRGRQERTAWAKLAPSLGSGIDAEDMRWLRKERIRLGFRDSLGEIFSTHPNSVKRIKALAELTSN